MPSERFFHLPKEKQKRIIQASIQEFSRVGYEQISINRIIRDAEISRGSFYQYFRDKDDLQSFLLKDFVEQIKHELRAYTENECGDLVQFSKDVLDAVLKAGKDEKCQAVCSNLFARMRYGNTALEDMLFSIKKENVVEEILHFMKQNYYPDTSMEELYLILEILASQVMQCIADVLIHKEPADQMREKFIKKLDLIEAGIKTKEKENA